MVNVTNGGAVSAGGSTYVGMQAGTSGVITVDGTGSTFTGTSLIFLGYNGTGTLNINNGGGASFTGTSNVAYIGDAAGSSGTINFGGTGGTLSVAGATYVGYNAGSGTHQLRSGGTLTTGTLYASPSQMTGTGTINTKGIVSDLNLAFNAAQPQSATQTVVANGTTFNITQSTSNALGVGYLGAGSLAISGGVTVSNSNGYLGYNAGSTGTATVTGTGPRSGQQQHPFLPG